MRAMRGLLVLCAVTSLSLLSSAQTIEAAHADASAIVLDGKLDEAVWQQARPVLLTQQSPAPGAPTPFKTEVRSVVTRNAVYFGFRCVDPQPRRIGVHTMQRDADMTGNDTVSIVLDTYGDHRSGYFFQVNAAGTRVDGLISNPESASLDWDGVWEAKTAITDQGWTAEIMIPSRTLGFSRSHPAWTANFERYVARQRTALRWASPTLDSFLYDVSRGGRLEGIGQLEQGLGLEFSPYVVGGTKEFFRVSPRAWQGKMGGEASWRVTPQLQSVFTVNTDFAETEVDARQVNITRFPLFFPEKRAFFLEGANSFDFGLGLNSDTFIPFFSRRIGLLEGQQIPIDAGAKVNGRIGKLNVALLDVQTRDTEIKTDTGTRIVPGTNLLASRISYDVTPQVRVGAIVTNGEPSGTRRNTFAGADAVYRTSKAFGNKNFLIGGWLGATAGDQPAGEHKGWGYKIDFPNDLLDCSHTLHHWGEGFDPELGFLPRPGTQRLAVSCAYQPRPSKEGPFRWVRQEFFENEFTRYTNAAGFLESWRYFMAPINVRMETGDRFEFNWVPSYEFLARPFEIEAGVVIPPGRYPFTRWRLEAQTSEHRAFSFGHTTWFGTFYNGTLTEWENFARWSSAHGNTRIEVSTVNNFGRLPQGAIVQRLWQLQTQYAWSPDLSINSFVQYDSESRNFGSNTRFRWTIKPGRELFVIWNRGWKQSIGSPDLTLRPESDQIAIKLRWTWRY